MWFALVLVNGAGEGLRWSRTRLGLRVGAPVACEFLTGGVDKLAFGRIAEVDDSESGDIVGSDNRATKRIADREREDGAK